MKKRGWIVAAAVAAAVAIGGSWAWQRGAAEQSANAPLTAAVTRGTVELVVLATGQVEAKQLVSVGGRVSGQIETLAVGLGDTVKPGDLIVQIDSRDQENNVAQAKANLANIDAQIAATEANKRKAELELERQQRLAKSDYSSRQTLETAEADLQVYAANLDALDAQKTNARIAVGNAQIALDRTTIKAPSAGTVVAVNVQQGQTVNATQSAPTMVKLADLDTVIVKAEISEADVVNVVPGLNATFTILGAETRFRAKVTAVEPAPSEIKDSDTISTDSAIYYNGILEVPNPEHTLRIGMTTQVTIVLDRAENVLTVPASALQRERNGTFVEVMGLMGPTKTAVEVGLNDRVTAEIRSGLSEGDRVVIGRQLASRAQSGQSNQRRMPPMGF